MIVSMRNALLAEKLAGSNTRTLATQRRMPESVVHRPLRNACARIRAGNCAQASIDGIRRGARSAPGS